MLTEAEKPVRSKQDTGYTAEKINKVKHTGKQTYINRHKDTHADGKHQPGREEQRNFSKTFAEEYTMR